MNEHLRLFRELSASEKWLLVGNVASAFGFFAIAVGTTLRLASDRSIPINQPIFNSPVQPSGVDRRDSGFSNRARDYFS